jgi:hypothetical protein
VVARAPSQLIWVGSGEVKRRTGLGALENLLLGEAKHLRPGNHAASRYRPRHAALALVLLSVKFELLAICNNGSSLVQSGARPLKVMTVAVFGMHILS